MEFHPIDIQDRQIYETHYRAGCRMGSDTSFVTSYAWANSFQTNLYIEEDAICMRGKSHKGDYYFMLPTGAKNAEGMLRKLYAYCHDQNIPFTLRWLQKEELPFVEKLFPGKLSVSEVRDAAEYVYDTESLITLSGKKLHAKRNHVNAFRSAYSYEIRPINTDNLTGARDFVLARCNSDEEKKAMIRLFDVYLPFSLIGMALYVSGQLVAVTIGENIGCETALIHLEKADTDFTGAYAAVNQLFIENFFSHTKYVNREEDMGIEGLRRAKLSYRPAFLLEKYTVTEVF